MLESRTEMTRGQATLLLALLFNSQSAMQGRGPNLFPSGSLAVANFYHEGPISIVADVPAPSNQTLLFASTMQSMGLSVGDLRLYDQALVQVFDIGAPINIPGGLEPSHLELLAGILTIDLGGPL